MARTTIKNTQVQNTINRYDWDSTVISLDPIISPDGFNYRGYSDRTYRVAYTLTDRGLNIKRAWKREDTHLNSPDLNVLFDYFVEKDADVLRQLASEIHKDFLVDAKAEQDIASQEREILRAVEA